MGSNESQPKGKTWAVIIGISDYLEISDLNYADQDALTFYEYLLSKAGGSIDSTQIQLLINEKANIGQIVSSFEWLKEKAKPNDRAIIYFSGHGDVETLTDAQSGFLLTYNTPKRVYVAGAFPVYLLKNYLNTLSNREVQVILIADACRSGKLAGGEKGLQQTGAALQQQWNQEVKVLSCQPGEISLESEIGGGRGIFSYYLINGLMGLADHNQDRQVNLSELNIYLSLNVPNEANPLQQNPLVMGNMLQVLATVDELKLQALQTELQKPNQMLERVASKGLVGQLLEENDPFKEKYLQFEEFLGTGKSYHPSEESAYSIYQEFVLANQEVELVNLMRRNLIAALQNEAQVVINSYLSGEVDWKLVSSYKKDKLYFGLAARKMEKCRELLSQEHPLNDSFMARQLFLEARAVRSSKDTLELMDALKKLDRSIQIEPNAAYSYHAKGLIYGRLNNAKLQIENYKKAIEFAPTWAFPVSNLGFTYFHLKDYDQAINMSLLIII